jgi:hypothetical protein
MVSLCVRAVPPVARRAPRCRRGERARDAAEQPRRRRDARPGRTAASASARSASDAEDDTAVAERVERETRAWLDTIVMGLNLCPFARAALPGTTVQVTHAVTLEALRLEIRDALLVLRDAPVAEAATTLIVLSPRSVNALGAATFEGFMEGARVVAEEEARRLTESLPDDVTEQLDLVGDLVEIVPFHPRATFGETDPSAEDEVGSGGYICTFLDTGPPVDDTAVSSDPPDEAALRKMIAEHAAMRGGADTRADWKRANAAGGKNDVDEDDDHDASFSDNTTNAVDPADYTGRSPHPVLHLLRQSDVDAADESWFDKGPGDDIRARNAALLRGMGEGKLRAMLKKCFESASRDESKRR